MSGAGKLTAEQLKSIFKPRRAQQYGTADTGAMTKDNYRAIAPNEEMKCEHAKQEGFLHPVLV